ncbi:hypothetical protein ABZ635_04190 [Nocardiopsis sp. NPDC007018]|uniref:hypothetical protein n=1 Tax=Nocardiopsis sp. NPDC007018 TaxID=3155721 RepID=UPI0033FD9F42
MVDKNPHRGIPDFSSSISSTWPRKVRKLLLLDNGTPVRSAKRIAEISVGLARAAYDASRRVGSGNEKIREKYGEGLRLLNRCTESAGLQAQVNAETRDIVKRDPKLSPIFKETAHGELAGSASETGERIVPMQELTLRPTMTPEAHYRDIFKTLSQRFSDVNNEEDLRKVFRDFGNATRAPNSPLRMGLRQDWIGDEVQGEIFRRSFKRAITESPPKLDMSPEFAALARVRIMAFVEGEGLPGVQEPKSHYGANSVMEVAPKAVRRVEPIFNRREVDNLRAYLADLAKNEDVRHEGRDSEERGFGF